MSILTDLDLDRFGINNLPGFIRHLVIEGGYLDKEYVPPRITIEYKENGEWLKITRNLKDKYGKDIEWQGPNSADLLNSLCVNFPAHTTYFKIELGPGSMHNATFVQYVNDYIVEYKDTNGLFLDL